jgi:hypothetical protein
MRISNIKDIWENPRPGIWYRPRTNTGWRQIYYEKICANCGEVFAASHKHLTYCSKSCARQCQPQGEKSSKWRGGRYIDRFGYVCVLRRDHPDALKPNFYIKEHRLVAEQMLGRRLTKNEVIHHLNGIKSDNRPENLVVTSQAKHIHKYHSKLSRK